MRCLSDLLSHVPPRSALQTTLQAIQRDLTCSSRVPWQSWGGHVHKILRVMRCRDHEVYTRSRNSWNHFSGPSREFQGEEKPPSCFICPQYLQMGTLLFYYSNCTTLRTGCHTDTLAFHKTSRWCSQGPQMKPCDPWGPVPTHICTHLHFH